MARRIMVKKPGGPEVLQLENYQADRPKPGEVLVRNLACGVAFADVMGREGLNPQVKLPFTPGYEIVGHVIELGAKTSSFKVGDYVAALTSVGGYASEVIVDEKKLVNVPTSIKPEKAAALILNGLTAYQMMRRCCPERIKSVVVFGATGGVGSILLDLARQFGITAYGVGNKQKHGIISEKGATPLERIDAVKMLLSLAPTGVDAVFDGIGGQNAKRSFSMLDEGGSLILFGVQAMMKNGRKDFIAVIRELMQMPWWSSLSIMASNKSVCGYMVDKWADRYPDFYRADLESIFDLAVKGVINPVVEVLDLSEAQLAHAFLNDAKHSGKIVLTIADQG